MNRSFNRKAPKKLIIYCWIRNPRIKQRDVAEVIGVDPSLISKIFSGERRLTEEHAQVLHDKLGIPYNVLPKAKQKSKT